MPVEVAVPTLLQQIRGHRVDEGHWTAQIDRDWWSWAGPHGGLLTALNLHAAMDTAPGMAPRALSVRFHGPSDDSLLDVHSSEERPGASTAIVTTETRQGGRTVLSMLTTMTAGRSGPSVQHAQPPIAAPPEQCEPLELPVEFVPFGQHVEIRPVGGALPLSGSDVAEMRAWLRLKPSIPFTAPVAAVLVDALAPGIFPRLTEPVAVPTVELSVHFHADLEAEPIDDYVLAIQRNVSCSDGWCIDETELWSPDGRLLVQGRQLRRILGDPDL